MKKNGELSEPDEDLDREMYYYAVETLAQRGFIHYEISNLRNLIISADII